MTEVRNDMDNPALIFETGTQLHSMALAMTSVNP